MSNWELVLAEIQKKINRTRWFVFFWTMSVAFWLWQLVTDRDWLVYAMVPLAGFFFLDSCRDLMQWEKKKDTAEAMLKASRRTP